MAAPLLLLLLLLLLLSPALLALGCDLPCGTCACSDSSCQSGGRLAWARIPPNSQGLGTFFRFGVTLNTNNPLQVTTGTYTGNRNYEYFYVNSTSAGSGTPGASVMDNLVDPDAVTNAPGPPLFIINDMDTCCGKCAAVPGCYYFLFYPLSSSVQMTGYYATENLVPVVGTGQPTDGYLFPYTFMTETLDALPPGVATQCVLLGRPKGAGRPNSYAFDGDANPTAGAANPKAIIGGTCNTNNPPAAPCP